MLHRFLLIFLSFLNLFSQAFTKELPTEEIEVLESKSVGYKPLARDMQNETFSSMTLAEQDYLRKKEEVLTKDVSTEKNLETQAPSDLKSAPSTPSTAVVEEKPFKEKKTFSTEALNRKKIKLENFIAFLKGLEKNLPEPHQAAFRENLQKGQRWIFTLVQLLKEHLESEKLQNSSSSETQIRSAIEAKELMEIEKEIENKAKNIS